MTRNGNGIGALDGMLEAEQLAEDVMVALEEGRYMIMPHVQVKDYLQGKAADYDRWVKSMQRLRTKYLPDL